MSGNRVVVWLGSMVIALGVARVARATSIFIEAESARAGVAGRITSPLLIKDDPLASQGSYIEVVAGNNSKTTMPASEGVVSLTFNQPDPSAPFTIWARVIAATDGDDSFWVKMDGGTPINWNGIPLGTAWHWVQVKADGVTTPARFTLGTGDHTLKIAYREDGTRLDALIVTSDASFNPNAPLAGPPATPVLDENLDAISSAGVMLTWQDVPGATSYTLTDGASPPNVIASGLTTHVRTQATDGCFAVTAVGPSGSSAPSFTSCLSLAGFIMRQFPDTDMSIVAPMKLVNSGLGTQSGTAESLDVVPAHGRGRFDFNIVGPVAVQVFAEISAPDHNNDSFWVRMDQGNWIKWNNIPDFVCSPVKNSDAGGATVTFTLGTGSHVIEFAYREIGEIMGRLAPTEANPFFLPCDD